MADEQAWLSEVLASAEAAPPAEAVAVMARVLADKLAAADVSFLITDLGGGAVVRMTGSDAEGGPGRAELIGLRGTVYEEVMRSQSMRTDPCAPLAEVVPGAVRVIAPVSDRGDAIGLLELVLPAAPDRRTIRLIAEAARGFAYVVIVNRRFTDLYEWGRRTTRLSLAAEIQHRLLPDSFTCHAGRFIVSGALEPAADIGGDTFDYALDRHVLHLSLTDAMGHDVQAALLATLLVGALRNARRTGVDLAAQALAAHEAVVHYVDQVPQPAGDQSAQVHAAMAPFGGQPMATGQLLRVDLGTGRATLVNAGHPWPLRLRDGRVEEIVPEVDLPFGVTPNPGYLVQSLDLREGDRLVLLTDGMLEPTGTGTDADRETETSLRKLIRETGDRHPREAVRAFTEAVLQLTGKNPRDDATVLCLDWPAPGCGYLAPGAGTSDAQQPAPAAS